MRTYQWSAELLTFHISDWAVNWDLNYINERNRESEVKVKHVLFILQSSLKHWETLNVWHHLGKEMFKTHLNLTKFDQVDMFNKHFHEPSLTVEFTPIAFINTVIHKLAPVEWADEDTCVKCKSD